MTNLEKANQVGGGRTFDFLKSNKAHLIELMVHSHSLTMNTPHPLATYPKEEY